MPADKSPRPSWPDRIAALAGVAASLALGYAALTLRLPPPTAGAAGPAGDSGLARPPALATCAVQPEGYWRGRISGSATLDLDWSGAALACAGNARPDGRGLRLFFAGRPGDGEDRLVFVVGIAAGAAELAGREWPASVTVIDEASSSFFHSAAGRCFTRVAEVAPLGAAAGGSGGPAFRVSGELYCAGAIAAVGGERAVTLGDTRYAGRLDLGAP